MTRPVVKERGPRVQALAGRDNGYMEIGTLPMFGIIGFCRRSRSDLIESNQTYSYLVSSQTVTVKTYRRRIICSGRMAVRQHPPNLRDVRPTQNYISRRVRALWRNCRETLANTHLAAEEANRTFSRVLRSELFGNTVPQADLTLGSPDPSAFSNGINDKTRSHTPPSHVANLPPASITPSTPHKNLFNYGPTRPGSGHPTPSKTPRSVHAPNLNARSELYSLSPIRYDSQRILETPRKQPRYVNKVPYKVLDAPDLQDDFYLNLVDWGSSNVLGVGLANSVYMWNSQSGSVTKLCELKDDTVTSVSWIQRVCF